MAQVHNQTQSNQQALETKKNQLAQVTIHLRARDRTKPSEEGGRPALCCPSKEASHPASVVGSP